MTEILTMSKEGKTEYCCSVVRIGELTPIEGSDFLAKTDILGTQIVVRKDQVHEGMTMFYASNETALNERFLSLNNLFEIGSREKNANYPEVKAIMDDYDINYRKEADELRGKAKDIKSRINSHTSYASRLNKQIKKLQEELDKSNGCSEEIEAQIREKKEKADEQTAKAMSLTVEYTSAKKRVEELVNAGKPIVEKANKLVGFFNKYGRVRCITLKGEPSFGFVFGVDEMAKFCPEIKDVNLEDYVGLDFDTVNGELFVKAFVPPIKPVSNRGGRRERKRNSKLSQFDRLVEGEFSFHYDTEQLNKNIYRFNPDTEVFITSKLHGCVEYNTIVNTMEFGDLKIGDIVNNKIACHIKSRDLEYNQDMYVPIDNFFKVENDGEWYEIELENNMKIIITGNNPVWLPILNTYRKVEDLDGSESLLVTM